MIKLMTIIVATGLMAGMACVRAADQAPATASAPAPATEVKPAPAGLSRPPRPSNPMMEAERKLTELGKQYRAAVTDEEKAKIKDEIQNQVTQIYDKRIETTKKALEEMAAKKKLLDEMTAKRDESIKARVDFVLNPPAPREPGIKKDSAKPGEPAKDEVKKADAK